VDREFVEIADRWRNVPGMVAGALQEVQQTFGYLPEEGLKVLAVELNVPLSQLFSVATFYSFFRLNPPAAHHVQVCEGTACHVLGAQQLSAKLCRDLKIGSMGVSEDYLFSVDRVRCLGCCSVGPVIRIEGKTFGRVRQKDLSGLLKPYQVNEVESED